MNSTKGPNILLTTLWEKFKNKTKCHVSYTRSYVGYYLCDGFTDMRCGIDALSKNDGIMRLSINIVKSILILKDILLSDRRFYRYNRRNNLVW